MSPLSNHFGDPSFSALNDDWMFCGPFNAGDEAAAAAGTPVRLPHNAVDLPVSYFDETSYQRAFFYQRRLDWHRSFEGMEISLHFDGAMADAEVFLNGEKIGGHKDGYTPFSVRLTGRLQPGANLICVKVDGSENPDIPPFGGQIDYLTYAGIYRDVWLRVAPPVSIGNLRAVPVDALGTSPALDCTVWLDNPQDLPIAGELTLRLLEPAGRVVSQTQVPVDGDTATISISDLSDIEIWRLDDPALYTLQVAFKQGQVATTRSVNIGFREAEFREGGFYLNGEKLHLRGLNRHQSYPYVGYAMGRRAQERDAEILRHDLKCNIVRTSHYPQSPWFLDHCDRLGLLVIEEIPGWQHIGGEAFKAESIANVERMIRRDWNHPSIVMWGVRINESADDREFYKATNTVAKRLDPTRATGGVRCIEDSELFEDVYTMNDFFHVADDNFRGNRAPTPLRSPAEVTRQVSPVPYLVTEFNGHMFPTKRTDSETRQADHVLRYLEVLDKAYGETGISGSIGWCMSDYNTHKDFGSGDRICHHGVLDMWRIPKFAAHVYAAQGDPKVTPVLQPVTVWARGEREIGGVLPLIVLTNCDYIDFRFGDQPLRRLKPDRMLFPNLPHAPVILDERTMAPEDIGAWGMAWDDGQFDGYLDGNRVITRRFAADPVPQTLEVAPDALHLNAADHDELRVVLRALDQADNVMPYLDDVLYLEVAGPAKVIGPDVLPLKGGVAGLWLKSTGGIGPIELTVFSQRLGAKTLTIEAR